MFNSYIFKIKGYTYRIICFSVLLLCIDAFFLQTTHSEEQGIKNVFNIRYQRYNPYYALVEQEKNNEIIYKQDKISTTEDKISIKNTKKYMNTEDKMSVEEFEENINKLGEKDKADKMDSEKLNKILENINTEKKEEEDNKKKKKLHNFSLGVHIGTTGLGANVIYNYTLMGIRLSADYLKLPAKINFKYFSIDLQGYNIGLIFFVRPFGGSFHINVGLFYLKLRVIGAINLRFILAKENNVATSYAYGQGILGLAFRQGIHPYFGFGWDINLGKYFSLNIDIGVLMTGKLKYDSLTVKVHKGAASNDNYQVTGLEEDVSYDTVRGILGKSMTNIIDNIFIWPVLKVGISYNF